MFVAAAIWTTRCSMRSALRQALTDLAHLRVARAQALLHQFGPRFRRVCSERFVRGATLFLRWPREKRIAKESMQARKRLRLGQLTEGFDGLEAETTSPAECIASAENVQQRIDSLLDAVVSYQSDGHLGELRIAGMDRLVQERAGNGGLQGDQRLDCFQS